MPIKVTIDEDGIRGALERATAQMIDQLVQVLRYVGEAAVNDAREFGSYKDQTGNLRSSVGYVIVRDGQIVGNSGFDRVLETATDGPLAGSRLAEKLAADYDVGQIALIVVAGMHYAIYVTAKGYNVINSAEILAENLLPKLLRQLNENWNTDTE